MERLLRHSGQAIPKAKRILELNPAHALMAGLKKLHAVDARSPRIADYAQLLYGQALLTEGSPLPDAGAFSKLVTDLMVSAVEG
jgi:molecular chaperone HtpG